MAKTHYDTLGIKRGATAAEVKSAYRKLVLEHHPDRSSDPRSREIFLRATEAYDALSDAASRRSYDEALDTEARRAAERVRQNVAGAAAQAKAAPKPGPPTPGWRQEPSPTNVAADVQRLTVLFARGRHAEAEKLARQISQNAPRHPVPYAVLGDIARLRGNLNEAARLYAYAAQFEPNNPVYQRRYEELLNSSQVVEDRRQRTHLAAEDRKVLAPMTGGGIVLVAALYLALGNENPLLPSLAPVSTWTLGLFVMLFLSGVGIGASLAVGNLLDRFQSMTTTATGRLGPNVALGLVAVANFWAAALLYLLIGTFQKAFNFSTTRLILGVAGATLLLALGAGRSPVLSAGQVALWGGNLVYVGALVGWMVADAFRA
ncbi:MAG: J domain-containing protein [Fimbriimonas sp.]